MRIKVREIKESVINNASAVEEKAFDSIIHSREYTYITKEELKDKLSNAKRNISLLAGNHIDANKVDLLEWYADDVNRLYDYANYSRSFELYDIITVLEDGQAMYWEEQITNVLNKLSDFLNNWS